MTNKSAELRPLLLRPGKQVLSESFGWVVLAGWRLRRAYNRSTRLGFDRGHYPRFFDGPGVRKFCVPILPHYHRQLFPEIAFGAELSLFPSASFSPMLAHGSARTPGNTIRKVYLCRAKIARLRPGDLALFYTLSLAPLASFDRWRGRSTAGPSH